MEISKKQGAAKRGLPVNAAEETGLQKNVRCPFYRGGDGQRRIVCEGFVDDSTITQTYRFQHLFKQQLDIFCCAHFQNCEVYGLLCGKYE